MIPGQQALPCRGLEYIVHSLTSERGTFKVFLGSNPLTDIFAFVWGQELFTPLAHLFLCYRIVAEIFFETDQDYGNAWAAFKYFGVPTDRKCQLVALSECGDG